MDEHRGGGVPADEHARPDAARPLGTNGAFVACDAAKAPFVPPEDETVTGERTASGVLVEPETLADGRAIRFFSWAPVREWPPMGPSRTVADPWRATRGTEGAS